MQATFLGKATLLFVFFFESRAHNGRLECLSISRDLSYVEKAYRRTTTFGFLTTALKELFEFLH